MKHVVVSGGFDDLRSREMRFLQEAAGFGSVHVYLWTDEMVQTATGDPPSFPVAERAYMVAALKYVSKTTVPKKPFDRDRLPEIHDAHIDVWAVEKSLDTEAKRAYCAAEGIEHRVIGDDAIAGFPHPPAGESAGIKKVLVTGCFDWFHSGHIRFFEEVSELGELYVVVGHDENVRLLKGEGHPLFPEEERRYLCGSIRHVHQALVSTGTGWMDAEPEIEKIKPDIYAVNEDGDKPEKLAFCKEHGLRYVVLKRTPKEGLERRSSTDLRGF